MADSNNELLYTVRFVADEKSLSDTANKLQQALDNTKKQASGEGQTVSDVKKLQLSLDDLTRQYLKKQKTLADLATQISGYKKQLADLNAEEKKNKGLTAEQAKIKEALGLSIRDTTTDYRNLSKEVIAGQVATESGGSSFTDLKARMASLRKEIEALDDPTGKNATKFNELTEEYKKLSAQSKLVTDSLKNAGKVTKESTTEQMTVLKALRLELKAKRDALASLNEAQRNGLIDSDSYAQAQQRLGGEIASVTQRIQEANRGYSEQEVILASTPNTYNEVVEQNRALSIAMRNVPLDDTTGQLKRLQAQYDANNNTLKSFDATVGNNQRNVGAYENSIRSAAAGLAIFQGPLGPIAGRLNSFATFMAKLNSNTDEGTVAWNEMGKAHRVFSVILTGQTIPAIVATDNATKAKTLSIRAANVGIKTLNVTLKLLRTALIATGIGAFVVILGSLYAWFKRTEEGAEALRVRTAQFRAVIDVLLDRFSALGEKIFEAFDDPKQAVVDLWEAIKTNIVNRIEGVGGAFVAFGRVVKNALSFNFDEAGDSARELGIQLAKALTGVDEEVLEGITDEIREEVKAAGDLEERMNAVLRATRDIGVERARQNRDLQIARDLARDMSFDTQERLAAIQLVRREELGLLERELAIENERLEVLQEQAALSNSDASVKQAIADQQAKIFQMEEQFYTRSIRLRRDEATIRRQESERELRRLRNRLDAQARAGDLRISQVRDEMTQTGQLLELALMEQQQFEATKNDEFRSIEAALYQEFLNQNFSAYEAYQMAQEQAINEMAMKELAINKSVADARLQREETTTAAIIRLRDIERETQLDADLAYAEMRSDGVMAAQVRLNDIVARQQEERAQRELAIVQQLTNDGMKEYEAQTQAKKIIDAEYAREYAEGVRNLSQAEFDARRAMLEGYVGLVKNTMAAVFGENKAVAVASAIIDTYAGATAALGMRPWTPINFINAAAVVAAGVANVRKIMSVKRDTKSINATSPQRGARTNEQFQLVETQNMNAMAVAGQDANTQPQQTTIILEGEFDREALAVKVREGNNALSSRGIALTTG